MTNQYRLDLQKLLDNSSYTSTLYETTFLNKGGTMAAKINIDDISKTLKQFGIHTHDIRVEQERFSPYAVPEIEIKINAVLDPDYTGEPYNKYIPEKIIRNKRTTIVIWKDKTKTIVRCEEDKCYDEYEAFTAALAKKIFQNNSKLKKVIKEKFVCQESDDAEIEWDFVSTPLSRAMNRISDAIKNFNADNETE